MASSRYLLGDSFRKLLEIGSRRGTVTCELIRIVKVSIGPANAAREDRTASGHLAIIITGNLYWR